MQQLHGPQPAPCAGRRDRSRDGKPFKEKVLHVTGAIFGQPKLREPQDSWDDGSRLLSVGSSTDPAHLTSFEGGTLGKCADLSFVSLYRWILVKMRCGVEGCVSGMGLRLLSQSLP